MYTRHIAFSISFFITLLSFAQTKKQVHFCIQYQPLTTYSQTIDQTSKNLITYSGSKEFLESLQKKGVSNPTKTETFSSMETEYKTGKLAKDSTFPITLKYLKNINSTGKQQIPDNTTIFGRGSLNDVPVFDSIEAAGLDQETKSMLLQVLQSTFKQLSLPTHDLNVGEEFTTSTPLSIPIAGVNLEMDITTHYKLVGLEKQIAKFEIIQEFTMKSVITKFKVNATGQGTGILFYDTNTHFYRTYETNTTMLMNFASDAFSMDLNSTSTFLQNYSVKGN